jgi:hypothetical protein
MDTRNWSAMRPLTTALPGGRFVSMGCTSDSVNNAAVYAASAVSALRAVIALNLGAEDLTLLPVG